MSKRKRAPSSSFDSDDSYHLFDDDSEDLLDAGDQEERDFSADTSSEDDNDTQDTITNMIKYNKDTIYRIVRQGHLSVFKKCANNVNILTDRDDKGNNYLHSAIKTCLDQRSYNNCKSMIQYLIVKAPQLLLETNEAGETPLFFACTSVCHHSLIIHLFEANPEALKIRDKEQTTPLHIVSSLLGHKKSMTRRMQRDFDFMFQKFVRDDVAKTSLELCELFIKNGADINAENKHKSNVLQYAIKQNYSFSDCKSNIDKEAHHLFVENMVQLLLKHGALFRSSSGKHAITSVDTERQAKWIIELDPTALEDTDGNWPILDHAIYFLGGKCEGDKLIKLFIKQGLKPTLALFSKARENSCNFSVIELFLEAFPNYDVNTRNMCGETLLIQYGSDLKTIEKLIKLRADITAVDNQGNTVLRTAAKKKDVAAVRLLLKLGVDPSKFSTPRSCIIVPISKGLTMKRCKLQLYLDLIKDTLEHPKMDMESQSIGAAFAHILDHILNPNHWGIIKNRLKDILTCILSSNECVKDMEIVPVKNENIKLFNYTINMPKFNILTYVLYSFITKNPRECDIQPLLDILYDCGLSFVTQENFISPLSLVLLLYIKLNYVDQDGSPRSIMDQKINMTSSTLEMTNYEDDTLGDIYKAFQIPDALFLAFMDGQMELLPELLKHYWGPPLSLLIFSQECYYHNNLNIGFSILMKYGGIPHGTYMFKVFENKFKPSEYEISVMLMDLSAHEFTEQYQNYLNYLPTPLSLQELCKYTVRECVAKNVARSGADLPTTLHALLPPLLRGVVIH